MINYNTPGVYSFVEKGFEFQKLLIENGATLIKEGKDGNDYVYKLSIHDKELDNDVFDIIYYFEIYDHEFMYVFEDNYPDGDLIYNGMIPTNKIFSEQLIVHLMGAHSS